MKNGGQAVTKVDYPRLCGGTYFTLVLQALKQRKKAREHYKGERDGLSDPEVLMGLIKVINPDFQEVDGKTLKSKANDYKACKTSGGTYLPFGDTQVIRAFDDRVRGDYPTALKDMTGFVHTYLDLGEAVGKSVQLVRALVDLIQQDASIGEDAEFYVLENGRKIKKAALGDLAEVCLPAFLLGVWHYVVVERVENTVGRGTYDHWCPSSGHGRRNYSANMGDGLMPDLLIRVPVETVQTTVESNEEPDDARQTSEESASQAPPPAGTPVYNSNPIFIQQNGDGNVVMPNYGTINITFGNK
jgi:hypothetical protein